MAKKTSKDVVTQRMFRDPTGQEHMFDKSLQEQLAAEANKPVECLGQQFPSDAERRKHFLGILEKKLKDPTFRNIDGFPIGTDEDILALSDPPYYTACPNPFIKDFIKLYGSPYDPKVPYTREPFAADVSEGKYDPIYKYHPYPTKVPHRAIMRYILHYTSPGDLVFDGFCGTGMTGVAAQMCGDKEVVETLGYTVSKDGTISRPETDENGKGVSIPFSKLGARRVVLNDLSPAAAFIAFNYNTPIDVDAFEHEARTILKQVDAECAWMYQTNHAHGTAKGKINYTVWSDVFVCPECTNEVIFWEAAVDKSAGTVREEFPCPKCKATLTKRNMERAWVTKHDATIKQTIRQSKQVPVLINYVVDGKRAEKVPDKADLALIDKIENTDIPYWFPANRMMEGGETRRNDPIGITHIHHFYTKRNLWVLAKMKALSSFSKLNLLITKVSFQITKLYRFTYQSGVWGAGGGPLSGTLYVPSLVKELNIYNQVLDSLGSRRKSMALAQYGFYLGTNQSSTNLKECPNESMDYIFIDPPFGANLNYSELCCLWEEWLKVVTNNKLEAIENDVQGKGIDEYRQLMALCFNEAYRVLKPGRWMTVEFSNTKASVWNSIQTALTEAGFIVANVSALDKQKGSFKAVTTPTAVKQDLVISAYKPNGGFESRFQKEADTEEGVWDFVRTHLKYLPVIKRTAGTSQLVNVTERDPRILFDRMVAYYVRSGFTVPINSGEFQQGLSQRFAFRDGMYFLPEQSAEYDKRRIMAESVAEQLLFVSDESSAIQWLRQILKDKPQIFSDINPQFMQQLGGWSKHEQQLDLRVLLNQNFLCYDTKDSVPEQIHAYLSSNWKELRNLAKTDVKLREKAKDRWYVPDPNKAGDLEKLRERALLSEFDEYKVSKQRSLKVFRTEAARAGFKAAYDRQDYKTIVDVAKKLPESVLQEDEKLLMYYDVATMRLGTEDGE
jgi:DNA modification methylase